MSSAEVLIEVLILLTDSPWFNLPSFRTLTWINSATFGGYSELLCNIYPPKNTIIRFSVPFLGYFNIFLFPQILSRSLLK